MRDDGNDVEMDVFKKNGRLKWIVFFLVLEIVNIVVYYNKEFYKGYWICVYVNMCIMCI